jgi:16S rRNA (guanine527-N7)-methyltransferase
LWSSLHDRLARAVVPVTEPVSRETPPAPEVASGVFSHHLPKAEVFAGLLAGPGVERGLIGPREVPRLWDRHLLNCALVGEAVPHASTVCDLGSGAGLPGLVLALHRPDLSITLVEPLLRRTTFLAEAVTLLDLENVEVVRGRAEELHGQREFDVVTARAVAPMERLLGWAMPLVRLGGELIAMKGSSAADELAAAQSALRKYGAGTPQIEEYGAGLVDRPTTVVRVPAGRPSRLSWDPADKGGARSPGSRSRSKRRRQR